MAHVKDPGQGPGPNHHETGDWSVILVSRRQMFKLRQGETGTFDRGAYTTGRMRITQALAENDALPSWVSTVNASKPPDASTRFTSRSMRREVGDIDHGVGGKMRSALASGRFRRPLIMSATSSSA